jgi:hypothetical protein
MWEAEVIHFVGLLSQVFPSYTNIKRCPSFNDLAFEVDWPLYTDSERPNKRSRLIVVCFSRELMADYVATPRNQTSKTKYIVEHIRAQYAHFNPNHDSPSNALPSKETWAI